MSINKPVLAGHLSHSLYRSLRSSKASDNVPSLLEQLLTDDLWREVYIEMTKQTVRFETFYEFVVTKPPEGLGSDIKTVRRFVEGNKVESMLDEVLDKGPGPPKGNLNQSGSTIVNNVHNCRPTGNSKQAGLRRLRKDRPDLLEQVITDKLTVNAAMVQAGFRQKTTTVRITIDDFSKKIKSNFSSDEIDKLIERIK